MQSNDLSQTPQTHRGRDLAIGGSIVSAALIATVIVCLPMLIPTLTSANGPPIMSAIAGGGTVSNATLKGDRLSNSRSKVSTRARAASLDQQCLPRLGPHQSGVFRLDAKAPSALLSGPATLPHGALLT